MSEFKVGDKVVNKSNEYLGNVNEVSWANENLIRLRGHDFCHVYVADGFRHATQEEIAAGRRIDKVVPVYANPKFTYTILTGAQVSSVLQITPQIDDMVDDFHLESHISPK